MQILNLRLNFNNSVTSLLLKLVINTKYPFPFNLVQDDKCYWLASQTFVPKGVCLPNLWNFWSMHSVIWGLDWLKILCCMQCIKPLTHQFGIHFKINMAFLYGFCDVILGGNWDRGQDSAHRKSSWGCQRWVKEEEDW